MEPIGYFVPGEPVKDEEVLACLRWRWSFFSAHGGASFYVMRVAYRRTPTELAIRFLALRGRLFRPII